MPRSAVVTLVGPGPGDPRWPFIVAGARAYARDFQWLSVVALNPVEDTEAAFRTALYEALRARPAVVCAMTPNREWLDVDLFVDANVALITIDADLEDGRVFGAIDLQSLAAAQTLGDSLGRIAAPGRSYVLIHEAWANERAAALRDRFSLAARNQADQFQLDSVDLSRSPRSPGETIAQIRKLFPNAPLFVSLTPAPWRENDPEALLGPTARFATLCGAPCFWRAIREGRCAAMTGRMDGEIGRTAIELAIAAITEPAATFRRRVVAPTLVTAENLEDFARRYAAAAGMSVAECEKH